MVIRPEVDQVAPGAGAGRRPLATRAQLASAAGGLAAPLIALGAFFGTGVMPPEAAYRSADQIAGFYAEHRNALMAGLIIAFMTIGLVGPLVTTISLQLRRAERDSAFGSTLQLVAGTVTWVFLSIPLLIMFVAAYRADRNPEITQTLHDLGWILFLIPVAPFLVQNLAIALVIFSDTGRSPVYPRWVAYANIFITLSFFPDLLLGYFRTGPLAYQGLFSFWIPTVTYGLWLNIMGFTTWRAIRQAERAPLG